MSRTYPHPESNGETVTCPLSCGQTYSTSELAAHVARAARAAVKRTQDSYARYGLPAGSAATACTEVTGEYARMLGEALRDQTPDWRNSDGLRGYADSVVRIIRAEVGQ